MITQVKEAVTPIKPKYNIVLERLHLYYDVKLVTFCIDENSDLII